MAPASGRPNPERGGRAELDRGPELCPLDAGGLLDASFEILRAHFLACAGTCALLWLPVRALQPYLGAHTLISPEAIEWDRVMLFLVSSSLLPVVIQTVGAGLVTTLVHGHMVGRSVGVAEALAVAGRKGAALCLVALAAGVIVATGTGTLGVMGFFCPPLFLGAGAFLLVATWRLWLAPAVLILEPSIGAARYQDRRARSPVGRGGQWIAATLEDVIASFGRSIRLTAGTFWRWLGVWVMLAVIVSFFQAPTALTDQPELRRWLLDQMAVPTGLFDLVHVLSTSLFLGVVTAFSAIVITVFYLDARIRREGLDLAMRLERLRLRAAAGRGAS